MMVVANEFALAGMGSRAARIAALVELVGKTLEGAPETYAAATALEGVCDLAEALSRDLHEMAHPNA